MEPSWHSYEINRLPALWNRNYFYGSGSDFWKLWFRFQLLKSYDSGSYFWKVTVTVPVPVPAPYLDNKKQIYQKEFWKKYCLST